MAAKAIDLSATPGLSWNSLPGPRASRRLPRSELRNIQRPTLNFQLSTRPPLAARQAAEMSDNTEERHDIRSRLNDRRSIHDRIRTAARPPEPEGVPTEDRQGRE